MDHARAVETMAAERYLLGELPSAEADDFERHFFECTDCATAVESGTQLIVGMRAELAASPQTRASTAPSRKRRGWWFQRGWVLAGAAAILLACIGLYQGAVIIPGLRRDLGRAVVLPAFQLAGASRGETVRVRIPPGAPFLALAADVPPVPAFPQYVCALMSGSQTVFRVTAAAPPGGQPITILVPVRLLRAGDYDLEITGNGAAGGESDRTSHYAFHFEIQ